MWKAEELGTAWTSEAGVQQAEDPAWDAGQGERSLGGAEHGGEDEPFGQQVSRL